MANIKTIVPTRKPGIRTNEERKSAIMNGGKRSLGVSNDSLKKLGRGLARAAGSGKPY